MACRTAADPLRMFPELGPNEGLTLLTTSGQRRYATEAGQMNKPLGRVDGFDKGFDKYYRAREADESAEGDVSFLAT